MDELSGPYWAGAREGRLVLQRCAACGRFRHYPQMLCPACRSFGVEHVEAGGGGTVHSWTVTHHRFGPQLDGLLPAVLVLVDLDEGVRVLGRLIGETPPEIGLPVTVGFADDGVNGPVPVVTPASGR